MQKTADNVAAINDHMIKVTAAVRQVGEGMNGTRCAVQMLGR